MICFTSSYLTNNLSFTLTFLSNHSQSNCSCFITVQHCFSTLFYHYSDYQIPWANVIAFNSDNCSLMKGKKGGVIAKIKEVNPRVIDIGCICHLSNLAVGASIKNALFNVDDLLCDIFHHFSLR